MIIIIRDGEELFARILHDGTVEQVPVYPEIVDTLQDTEILVVLETDRLELFAANVDVDPGYAGIAVVLVAEVGVVETALAAVLDFLILDDTCVVLVLDAHLEVRLVNVNAAHQSRGLLVRVVR